MDNLRQLDLNLLRTLDVLLAEHSVTRAAQRLHLSQPTVSVQLAKLREALDDPLLVPDARGMRPTARADTLREPLHQILHSLSQLLAHEISFDPKKDAMLWRIAAFDYSESTVIQPLLKRLQQLAPQAKIALYQLSPKQLQSKMERGEIDLAFHTADDAPPMLHARTLFHEHYRLVGRKGHPALQRSLTLKQFCQLKQVVVSPEGGGFQGDTDLALEALGLQRRVVLSVPHFLFLREVLCTTDLVAMMPQRLIDPERMECADLPIEVNSFELLMLWHERSHRDSAHQWLRNCIVESLNT